MDTRHKKLPTSLFLFARDHPEQVRIIRIKDELADDTKSRPSARKIIENKIQSAFENKPNRSSSEKTINAFNDCSFSYRLGVSRQQPGNV